MLSRRFVFGENSERFRGKFDFGKFHGCYFPGSAKRKEDGYLANKNFLGVFDGYSEPNCKENPQIIEKGMSLGELTARKLEEEFNNFPSYKEPLSTIIKQCDCLAANEKYPFASPEVGRLAGASAAIVRPGPEKTETVSIGDCFVLVELVDQKFYLSSNQVKSHDTKMHQEISRIKYSIAKDWKIDPDKITKEEQEKINNEMWVKFYPFLKKERGIAMNNPKSPNGYASLNGEVNLKLCQKRDFFTKDIAKIILFSDGLIPWKFLEKESPDYIAKWILEMEKRVGLAGVIQATRSHEFAGSFENYVSQHEATGIVLNFQ